MERRLAVKKSINLVLINLSGRPSLARGGSKIVSGEGGVHKRTARILDGSGGTSPASTVKRDFHMYLYLLWPFNLEQM